MSSINDHDIAKVYRKNLATMLVANLDAMSHEQTATLFNAFSGKDSRHVARVIICGQRARQLHPIEIDSLFIIEQMKEILCHDVAMHGRAHRCMFRAGPDNLVESRPQSMSGPSTSKAAQPAFEPPTPKPEALREA